MIKVFEFEVCNASTVAINDDKGTEGYRRLQERLKTPSDIEGIINEFLLGRRLISLHTNTVDMHYHNNGRSNTSKLVYTLVYEDLEV